MRDPMTQPKRPTPRSEPRRSQRAYRAAIELLQQDDVPTVFHWREV
jgi:hypothetical protein